VRHFSGKRVFPTLEHVGKMQARHTVRDQGQTRAYAAGCLCPDDSAGVMTTSSERVAAAELVEQVIRDTNSLRSTL
jgi:hypothetical protein